MGRVSQWAVRRPVYALLTWVGIMILVGIIGTKFGGDYNDNFQLPDTESTTAQDLLSNLSGGAGTGAGLDGQVVWKPESGKVTDAAAKAAMTAVLTELSTSKGVTCVITPFGDRRWARPAPRSRPARAVVEQGQQQPQLPPAAEGAMAHFGQAGMSPDGTVAYGTVSFAGKTFNDLNTADLTKGWTSSRRRTARTAWWSERTVSSARSAANHRRRRASASASPW